MPRTLRAGQCAQLFVIDATSGERRLLYESRTQLFEAPNWTSVQDSRHGAKVVRWSGPGFDFVAQDEVGAPSPYENGLRVRVGRGPQLGLALSGSSFGDRPAVIDSRSREDSDGAVNLYLRCSL